MDEFSDQPQPVDDGIPQSITTGGEPEDIIPAATEEEFQESTSVAEMDEVDAQRPVSVPTAGEESLDDPAGSSDVVRDAVEEQLEELMEVDESSTAVAEVENSEVDEGGGDVPSVEEQQEEVLDMQEDSAIASVPEEPGKDDGDSFIPSLTTVEEKGESQCSEPEGPADPDAGVKAAIADVVEDDAVAKVVDAETDPAEVSAEAVAVSESAKTVESTADNDAVVLDKTNDNDLLEDIEMTNVDESRHHVDEEEEGDPMDETDNDKSHDRSTTLDPFDQVKHAECSKDESLIQANISHATEGDISVATTAADLEDSEQQNETAASEEAVMEPEGGNQADETGAEDGVDELTEGVGVDENVCLLPDDDREPSDADKEQARAVRDAAEEAEKAEKADKSQEAMETSQAEGEVVEIDAENQPNDTVNETDKAESETTTTETGLETDQEKSKETPAAEDAATVATPVESQSAETLAETRLEASIDQTEETEPDQDQRTDAPPQVNEIREVPEPMEQTCLKCDASKVCEYSLIQEDGEEARFICSFDCVQLMRTENPGKFTLIQKRASIVQIFDCEETCMRCTKKKNCKYRFQCGKSDDKEQYRYLCDMKCVEHLTTINGEKYVLKRKRYLIDEKTESEDKKCIQCNEVKSCKYVFSQDDDELFICHEDCLNLLMTEHQELFRLKRRSVRVRDLPKRVPSETEQVPEVSKVVARTEEEAEHARLDREASFMRRCAQCFQITPLVDKTLQWETLDFCNEKCLGVYQNSVGSNCAMCSNPVSITSLGKYCVRFGFDVRQFCRSSCLDQYKKKLKVCSYCQRDITVGELGFLAPVGDKGLFKDFCTQACLKKYEEVLDPRKRQVPHTCAVCNHEKITKINVLLDNREHFFCSTPCFSAFKFVNNVCPDECAMCKVYFERKSADCYTIFAPDRSPEGAPFCSKICMNLFIITNRKIVSCNWCKVKKYNFDMIQKATGNMAMCSLNCLTLCEVSVNALSMKQIHCDHCKQLKTPQYHLTMSDASVRNFCTYQCVMSFQSQFNKTPLTIDSEESRNSPVPTGLPKRVKKTGSLPAAAMAAVAAASAPQPSVQTIASPQVVPKKMGRPPRTAAAVANAVMSSGDLPVISSVQSLAPPTPSNRTTRSKGGRPQSSGTASSTISTSTSTATSAMGLPELRVSLEPLSVQLGSPIQTRYEIPEPPPPRVELKTQIVTVPPIPPPVANAGTMCKPIQQSKAVSCRPVQCNVECQTEEWLQRKIVIPIPVPIYVPTPMQMYSLPVPIPIPFPLPIPVPIFIPTTRNSANGIMKEIKKIQDKMPTDPYEAELLMMAEMVAGDKKKDDSDSDSDDAGEDQYTTTAATDGIENNTTFNEDLVQMALKMASNDFEDPPVDLESAMQANTIAQQQAAAAHHGYTHDDGSQQQQLHHHQLMMLEQQRQATAATTIAQPPAQRGGRKRGAASPRANNNNRQQISPNKRIKREQINEPSPEPPREPTEKPDANMCLKYTFGVNAWKQWVLTKNADLEKSTIRRKPFKSEILQLTADELNYSLCLFVKEVRKPNGTEYAPDTIYYLVLGIQQYLFENGRIDNIFTDPYYERFTDCLDEVAKKFSVLYNDSQYIVTRVEEEHLWECKQLGAHSPHVLLSTLMFFNTKHFNLTTVEEHMELSFSHIMKHWKRNPNQGGAKMPGSRNVLLRFYPPQSSLAANSRKKKVYEQQENEENPLRCPVKLYEFYLSKCPESVKTRNDVFYLQPERSCVPDSPVWYSTQALSKDSLSKMLHRVKMVKEINIALLTS
ncbi:zinc finger MYM-type protein 4 [Toxorhynchites rutilus septentrionalis]|uniref:zinc finger MYM-type protein 4 n=1 Tax=Toxorhynchites rutilus septentrionalis TaxID=329112 RepID=UPI00247931B8|nr:zinc finger MYM-type protein 4 [Toxorhynchites rutilus septentrionalis]XP_055635362.1 zinc finger MYM-type protein 4 [Toxorhynchites rutilus septentrionalis]